MASNQAGTTKKASVLIQSNLKSHSETKKGGWHHTQLHVLCHPTAKFGITDARFADLS